MAQFNKLLKSFRIPLLIIPVMLSVPACNDSEEIVQSSRLVLSLVDSPADYEAVNIDIREISLKTSGMKENNGWIKLEGFEPGVYNILEFTGGHELKLADMEFPAGKITQLQLKIGSDNSLIIRDYTSNLLNSNNSSSGILLNVDIDIQPGVNHYYKLDFDASRSVVALGKTGQMILKPVLRLFSDDETGSVTGKVLPASENVLINVIEGSKIVASSYATKNVSAFLIPGIDEGIYRISLVMNNDSEQIFFENIEVVNGKVKDLGIISLED